VPESSQTLRVSASSAGNVSDSIRGKTLDKVIAFHTALGISHLHFQNWWAVGRDGFLPPRPGWARERARRAWPAPQRNGQDRCVAIRRLGFSDDVYASLPVCCSLCGCVSRKFVRGLLGAVDE
jgi:hypothetical protein